MGPTGRGTAVPYGRGGSNPSLDTNADVPKWFNGSDCRSGVRQFESDHQLRQCEEVRLKMHECASP